MEIKLIIFHQNQNPLSWIISNPKTQILTTFSHIVYATGTYNSEEEGELDIRLRIAHPQSELHWIETYPEIQCEKLPPKKFILLEDCLTEINGSQSNAYSIGFITAKHRPNTKITNNSDPNILTYWFELGFKDCKDNISRI